MKNLEKYNIRYSIIIISSVTKINSIKLISYPWNTLVLCTHYITSIEWHLFHVSYLCIPQRSFVTAKISPLIETKYRKLSHSHQISLMSPFIRFFFIFRRFLVSSVRMVRSKRPRNLLFPQLFIEISLLFANYRANGLLTQPGTRLNDW